MHVKPEQVFRPIGVPNRFTQLIATFEGKIYIGYYTVARRYEFYVRMARTISFEEDPKIFPSYTNELKYNLRDKLDIIEIIDI